MTVLDNPSNLFLTYKLITTMQFLGAKRNKIIQYLCLSLPI